TARRNQPNHLSPPLRRPAAGNHRSIKAGGTHKAQLKSALRRDRDGKSRKTLIQQLKKELDRR
ncbi:hypothetical protein ACIBSS_33795, partial [Micromonospora aurantiaca]